MNAPTALPTVLCGIASNIPTAAVPRPNSTTTTPTLTLQPPDADLALFSYTPAAPNAAPGATGAQSTPNTPEPASLALWSALAGIGLIRVRAFGLNRSELHTRLGLAEGVTFPRVLGIEAAGEVADCPGGEFTPGQQVAAMMGGMADPQTGQAYVNLEGAREVIDMLDALREKLAGR